MGSDARRLVVGFSYSMLAGVLSSAFLYAAGLIVMRLLGPREYGLYQLVFIIPGLLVPVLSFGIETTLVRFVSRFLVSEPEKGIRTARFLFFMRTSIAASACLAVMASAPWLSKILGEDVTVGVQLAGLVLLANLLYLFMQSYFQAFFLMRDRTIITAIFGACYLVFVPIFIVAKGSYLAPLGAFALSGFVAFGIGVMLAKRQQVNLLSRPSREGLHLTEQLKFAAPTYLTLLLTAFFTQAGIILIRLAGMQVVEIGYFRAAYNIVTAGAILAGVLNVVVLPYVSELEGKGSTQTLRYFSGLIIRFLILVATPAALGLMLVARPLLSVLLPQYLPATAVMKVLCVMLVFFTLLAVTNTILTGVGRPLLVLASDLLVMVVLLPAGFFLGNAWGVIGIAYAYVVAVLAGAAFSLVMIAKFVGLDLSPLFLGKVALSTAAMAVVVHLWVELPEKPVMQVGIGILLGILVYGAAVLLSRAMSHEDVSVIRTTFGIARGEGPEKRE